jgi:ATP-dependent Lhr-like helicase
MLHDRLRQEMRQIFMEDERISFCDSKAVVLLDEDRQSFRDKKLEDVAWFIEGKSIVVPTWKGDWTSDASALLITAGA